jgi:putative ABC transport system ATP-binding protein
MSKLLEARQISRRFGRDEDSILALSNVSISIGAGEFVALEGPSGCGKSTLLHILGGLDVPDQGEVRIGAIGQTPATVLSGLSDSERSRFRLEHVGMVLPVVDLIGSLSSWENVALPLLLAGKRLNSGRARAESLLGDVGLAHRIGVAANRLSTGEAQRVSLARALFHSPPLLIADEPTSFLDSVRSDEVLGLLRTLADGGQTIVMATHDPRAAAYADRSIRILDGQIVEP